MIGLFRKRKGIHIPYNKQGLIHFTCLDIENQSTEVKEKIISLCKEISEKNKEDYKALYDIVTSDKSIISISRKYYISERKLYAMRKQFYEKW